MIDPAPHRLEGLVWLDGVVVALVFGAIAASGFGPAWVVAFLVPALLASTARVALNVRGVRALLAEQGRATRTDPLTGLGNRRALLEHLEEKSAAPAGGPLMLAVFALDGLQHYNEAYGGLAGDAMVRRLADRLRAVTALNGTAFRPAGGRFAVVQQVGRGGFTPLLTAATAALSETGEGFCIDALGGAVVLPEEADTPARALLVADRRLMARRESSESLPRPSLRSLVGEALRRRREPVTAGAPTLAALARGTAARLGLDSVGAARAALAAELHAIGKLAVPREILAKPGRLSRAEWEFIEHHAIVGERLTEVAVDAPEVAGIVRASHEHHDGSGYPDGLAGDAIPVEARIAAVCAAYEAMLTPRPHRPARSSAEALEELRRVSGQQFDPAVVRAFRSAVSEARSARTTHEIRLPLPTPAEG